MIDSPHYGIMKNRQLALVADIASGRISGMSYDSILLRELPTTIEFLVDDAPKPLPGIIISPAPQGEEITPYGQGGGQAYDEIGYPILVVMIDKQTTIPSERRDYRANLRRLVMGRFRTQSVTITEPATTFDRSRVIPGPVLNHRKLQERRIWASAFVSYFYTIEAVPAA